MTPAFQFFYFTSFAVLGVYLPYFNVYLSELRFSPFEIGVIAALPPLMKIGVPVLWAHWADRFGLRRELSIAAALMASVFFAALLFTTRFLPVLAIMALFSIFWAPVLPLVEAATLEAADRHTVDYGRIRLWGSVGFIVVSVGLGVVLDRFSSRWIIVGMLGLLAANALAAARLPESDIAHAPSSEGLAAHLRRPAVVTFLAVCFLMQVSHGTYYGFFSIHLAAIGYSKGEIGALWAFAVFIEIAAMAASGPLIRAMGSAAVLTLALVAGVLRWSLYAATDALPLLILAQSLHALTFAAFHVAAVLFMFRLFPPQLRAVGQSLYGSASYGLGLTAGMLLNGAFYELAGPRAMFGASAVICAAAAVISVRLWRD